MSLLQSALVMSCVAVAAMLVLAWLAYADAERKG